MIRIKEQTWKWLFLLILFTLVNIGGKFIAVQLKLPVWMDCAGTCLAAYYLGAWGAILAGLAGNIAFGIADLPSVLYAAVSVVLALIFRYCVRKGYLEHLTQAMISSFVLGNAAVLASIPINLYFQGGYTGNMWGDALFDMLQWYGYPKLLAAAMDEGIVDFFDKQLCVLFVYLVVHLLRSFRRRWESGAPGKTEELEKLVKTVKTENSEQSETPEQPETNPQTVNTLKLEKTEKTEKTGKTGASAVLIALLVFGVCAAFLLPVSVYAQDEGQGLYEAYKETVYDSSNGMSVSEANVIAETEDGYIWIGSYAGLTRYDGNTFEFVRENGAASVTTMLTASDGRLWIGTNDAGIICYQDGVYSSYTANNGLPVNSIRAFAECEDGTMYVGTTDQICKIAPDGTITVLNTDVTYVQSLLVCDGILVGVSNDGRLFTVENDQKVRYADSLSDGSYFTCVANTPEGLIAGTSTSELCRFTADAGEINMTETLEIGELNSVVNIGCDSENHIWICTESGFGYLDTDGKLYCAHYDAFAGSVQNMHEDYEGNLWFASSRYGVLKLSENDFKDMFASCGKTAEVTNAVALYNGLYYCGTDDGLVILNTDRRTTVENDLTEQLKGYRVRSLMEDTQGNLWISTYSDLGLVCLEKDGNTVFYNTDTCAVTGNRFRCTEELSDGSIAAGTSSGINVFKDGSLLYTVNQQNGLKNEQILCLLDAGDGSFYAGTDGAGIYRIRDGKITENIALTQGLSSDIVLRMTRSDDGIFIVTGNALQYYDGTGIRQLEYFPYFNNYDILIQDEYAFITSSCGIYQVRVEDLLSGGEFAYKLYSHADGLINGLTSNSWNCFDTDGALLLCSNGGLIKWNLKNSGQQESYRLGLSEVRGDETVYTEKDGVYEIPADASYLTVRASVRNYALSSVKVRFFIDGLAQNTEVVEQQNLQTIRVNNVTGGSYTVHLQVLSSDESEILQEETWVIQKKVRFWETSLFKVYLAVIVLWTLIFAVWVFVSVYNLYKNRRLLQKRKEELEQIVSRQTEDIRTQAAKMERFQWNVIESMASLIESRDGNTGEHILRTREYVSKLVLELQRRGMYPDIITPVFVEDIIHLAPLHDVGKIMISDVVLNKPGKLTDEEYAIMKMHTVYGGEIIGDVLGKDATPHMLNIAHDLATYHHERPDGRGYPEGLKGEEIPMAARIMSIADVFDAITSERVYKKAASFEDGLRILEENAGTQFDPELVRVFLEVMRA